MAKNEKTYTSFEEYTAIKNAIAEKREQVIKLMGDAARTALSEIEALEEQKKVAYKTLMPEVGMGATEVLYSDYRAKTVVEVVNANTIIVAENETRCLDYYGDKYEILDTLSNMPHEIYTRRKSGRWVMKGQPDSWGSVRLNLGVRHHSIDPSF